MARALGLFGGSFDPIHLGHVAPVQAARRALGLERVLFLPTAQPPHKRGRRRAPALARYSMVELALLREEGLFAHPHELTLGRPAYTVETLEWFRDEDPERELFLLVGEDSYRALTTWRRWPAIPRLTTLAVLRRPGAQSGAAGSRPPELAALEAGGRVVFVDNPPRAVSATEIRESLRAGRTPPAGSLDDLVLDYIRKYRLYDD